MSETLFRTAATRSALTTCEQKSMRMMWVGSQPSPQPYYRKIGENVRIFFPIVTTASIVTLCHMIVCQCQKINTLWARVSFSTPLSGNREKCQKLFWE